MHINTMIGILIPFIGTSLGAAMVFVLKENMSEKLQKALTGFAASVMVAASFWSLLVPSLEQSESLGKLAFIPAAVGFLIGVGFLLILDEITPHMHLDQTEEKPKNVHLSRSLKLVLAITLHNIPEGMAVGVVYAGWLNDNESITYFGSLALALGIAIQIFPEGAIVSMPLMAEGIPKWKTFLYGVLSGLVEPIGSVLTIIFASQVVPLLSYFLSFAAGAMMYVVVEDLIPKMSEGKHSNIGTVLFAIGFVTMIILDVSLG